MSFTQREVVGLFDAARAPSPRQRDIWPVRDRAVLAVLLGAGPRSAELVGLMDDHLSLTACSLRVGSARTTTRQVPLSAAVATAVESYLTARTVEASKGPLFVRTDGRPLSPTALRTVLRRGVLRVRPGMAGRDWVRAFRDTYVSWQLGGGVGVPTIASRLGVSADDLAAHVSGFDPAREIDLDAALGRTAP
jgi:site-specific recombinase XerD